MPSSWDQFPQVTGVPGVSSTQQLEGLRGQDFLNALPDSVTRDAVKAVAEYRVPASGRNLQRLMELATQYDPNFDQTKYPVALQTRKSFASGGKDFGHIQSYGQAIGHAVRLDKAIDALGNSVYGAGYLNKIVHGAKDFLGNEDFQAARKTFVSDKDALSSELAAAFRRQGVAEADIKRWEQNLAETDSPVALRAGIREAMHLLGARMETTVGGWNGTFPNQPKTVESMLEQVSGPEVAAHYRRLSGLSPLTGATHAPAGAPAAPIAAPAAGPAAVGPGGPNPSLGYPDGAIAKNPQTGERIMFRNGAWQPVQ